MRRPASTVGLAVVLWWAASGPAAAQAQNRPLGPLGEVDFEQKLDAAIPLDLPFRDETGRPVRLGDYFGDRPVVLSLVYFDCSMLCSYVLDGEVRALDGLGLEPGADFEIVTVSFDPRDTPEEAAREKASYLRRYGRAGAGPAWHFLTGEPASIEALTDAVGFRYRRDEKNDRFAHAAGIMVTTPDGRLSRYFFGVDYDPSDLRLALVEASDGGIGSPVDRILLYCCQYDPTTGRYGVVIMNVLRLAGGVTLVLLGALIGAMMLRGRRRGAGESA